ncbi:DUF4097 family beta strand repeat-containing protein [Croceitalea rosinachiae]|uniref:DUF4097 family beta strand repeat-containing protein n=1 Tax=Croceitalea rosinachiae TaxID=3075596 RepID=A0ABU3A744_9FLAO|nr:DUF4097 family beta strand repeat-containing protein [Croceitalea sp. F388]MDT0605718.1 DUF4097 family beta strand repeat-containing protein [Croceitalea sp. F388]
MRKTIICLALTAIFLPKKAEAQKKSFKEVIEKEVSFTSSSSENTLVIQNIFGPIEVEGYSGSKVSIEVERAVFADNTVDLELGKKELQIKILELENRIVLHPDAPYISYNEKGLKFDWCNNNEEPVYEHKLSFRVKVPKGINLDVATVNEGDISITNTQGDKLKVNNINGGIDLVNVQGQTNVHCINGGVNISYTKNPGLASKYYSLNGDINVTYQESLSADVSFKSMNGELYTDFDIAKQFNRTNKESNPKGKAKYKYESTPVVQIGSGGVDFKFETLNGNVFIKKI